MSRKLMSQCAAVLLLSGCAVMPLPEDYSGVDTYDIAQTILCETRNAIRQSAANVIGADHPDLAAQLLENPEMFATLKRSDLSRRVQKVLDRYDQAAISFDFTFDMTEKNDVSASLDITRLWSRGPLKTGLGSSQSLERRTRDNFRTAASFQYLASVMPQSYCNTARKKPHMAYPVTGTIGMKKLIQTFISLNQSGSLTGTEKSPDTPVKVTTLDFTTEIKGNVNPVLELAAVGTSVTGASLNASASRKDLHTVIIAMALPPEGKSRKSISELRAIDAAETIRLRQAYDDRTKAIDIDQ